MSPWSIMLHRGYLWWIGTRLLIKLSLGILISGFFLLCGCIWNQYYIFRMLLYFLHLVCGSSKTECLQPPCTWNGVNQWLHVATPDRTKNCTILQLCRLPFMRFGKRETAIFTLDFIRIRNSSSKGFLEWLEKKSYVLNKYGFR